MRQIYIYVLIHIFSNRYFGFAKISDSWNLKRQHSQYLHNCNLCNCNFNYLNRYANLSVIPYSDSNPDIIDQFHPNRFNSDMQSPRSYCSYK